MALLLHWFETVSDQAFARSFKAQVNCFEFDETFIMKETRCSWLVGGEKKEVLVWISSLFHTELWKPLRKTNNQTYKPCYASFKANILDFVSKSSLKAFQKHKFVSQPHKTPCRKHPNRSSVASFFNSPSVSLDCPTFLGHICTEQWKKLHTQKTAHTEKNKTQEKLNSISCSGHKISH